MLVLCVLSVISFSLRRQPEVAERPLIPTTSTNVPATIETTEPPQQLATDIVSPTIVPVIPQNLSVVSLRNGQRIGMTLTQIEGEGTAGYVVEIFDNARLLGKTTVNPDSRWMLELTEPLPVGDHLIKAEMIDGDGNLSGRPVNLVVTVLNMDPPTINTDDSSGQISVKLAGKIRGTATPNLRVRAYLSEVVIGEVVADSLGQWELEIPNTVKAGGYQLIAETVGTDGQPLLRSIPATLSIVP